MAVSFDVFYQRAKQRYGDLSDDYIASEYQRLAGGDAVLTDPKYKDNPLGDPGIFTDIKRGLKLGLGQVQEQIGAGRTLVNDWMGTTQEPASEQPQSQFQTALKLAKLGPFGVALTQGMTAPEQVAAGRERQARNASAASINIDISTPEGRSQALEHPIKYGASQVSQMIPGMVPAFGAGLIGGGPVAFGAMAGLQEALPDYLKMREQGMSKEEATARMAAEGVPIGLLNILPGAAILGKLPGGKKVLGRMIAGGSSEGLTELAEEPVSAAAQSPTMAEIPGRAWEATKRGVNVVPGATLAGILFGGLGGGSSRAQTNPELERKIDLYVKATGKTREEAIAEMQAAAEGKPPVAEPAATEAGLSPEDQQALSAAGQELGVAPAPTQERIADTDPTVELPQPDFSQIDNTVSNLTASWGTAAPKLNAIDDETQLDPEQLKSLGAGVLGWTDLASGEIGLVRKNILAESKRTGESVPVITQRVMAHESVGHFGMQRVLGKDWLKLLDGIPKLAQIDGSVKTAFDEVGKLYKGESNEVLAAETLARMAEMNPQHSLVKQVFAQIREGLRKMGFNIEYSDNDIIALLRKASLHNQSNASGVIGTTMQNGLLAAKQSPLGFVSGLEQLVETAQAPKATGEQWLGYLNNKGAKADEMKWTSTDDWLREQKGAVTKEALAEHVRSNKVDVQEVTLGTSPLEKDLTKFSNWQLPGGENYRELLLTLPVPNKTVPDLARPPAEVRNNVHGDGKWYLVDIAGEWGDVAFSTRAEAEAAMNNVPTKRVPDTDKQFTSGHYDTPNILAHVRFNERTDADGKRVLFIEEIQSDWAQKGRKEGFGGRPPTDAQVREYFDLTDRADPAEYRQEMMDRMAHKTPPAAPFVTKTEGWSSLAMKRMVRWAAENGFDRVAWTPGDVQADRYDLSKHLSSVRVHRADGGQFRVEGFATGIDNARPEIDTVVSADKLADTVGKDLAEKIASDFSGDRSVKRYSGVDLKVGGEGMRGFYDKILVDVANKLGKKFGTRVGKTKIGGVGYKGDEFADAHSLDITPAMRESVMQGQALFAARPKQQLTMPNTPTFVQWKANKEGGQAFGNQEVFGLLNEATFNQYVSPLGGKPNTWAAYHRKYPDTGIRLISQDKGQTWKIIKVDNIMSIYNSVTQTMQKSKRDTGQPWAKFVDNLNSSEAIKFGSTADSDLLAARPSEQMGAPEEQPQIPPKVEVGGGEYSTAELGNLSPQVANVMVTGLSALEKQVADQRGGPRTWSEIDASKNRRSYQQAYHDLINRRLGGIAGDKQMDAFGDLVVSAGTELSAALDEVNRTGSAQSIARAAAAREKYGLLAAPYAGYKTELGRGLAIIRKAKSRMQQADQIFEALGDGTEQAIKDFARSAKGKNLTQLLDQTAASYQPTVQDQFREYWINSILSGPWTHVVNIASNNLFVALESVAELATSLVSKDISTRAALARVTGMLSGMQLGAANFGKALKTGDPQLSQHMQIEQERRNAIPGKIGHIIRFPGRALTAADEFAKAMAFTGQLHYMAMEEAQKRNPENPHAVFEEVLRSYANNDAVQAIARQHADRMTFQKDLGPTGKQMMALRSKLGPVGWLLVPFVRTPTNIVKEFAKFTPAGLAMPSVLSDLNLPGAPRARAMGRMLVGSTVMAGAVSLVVQGLMTGNGPPDKTRRDAWLLTGRKPYSVKVGDQWIKYNRLEPVGMLLGMAADMTEMGRAAMLSDQQGEKLATMMLASFMTNLADKTFLRGIVDFTQAATDPGRYMAQWASSMAGSMIPNIAAQAARGMDPYVREGRNFLDSLQARVPGMREDLPAKLDLSGQPIQNSVVEPFASATAKNDPLAETMLQLDAAKGAPSRTLTIQGHRYEMTGDEYESYMGFAQQARWNVLTPIVSSPGFKQLASADSLKARDAFEQLWDKVGSQARDVWLLKHPEVVRKISQQAISQNSSTYVQ